MEEKINFQDYCPKCMSYDSNIGVCSKIHLNIKDYPAKFQNKCAGEYFEQDEEKVKKNEFTENKVKQTDDSNISTFSGFSSFLSVLGWLLILFSIVCLLDFILIGKLFLIKSEVEGLILLILGINSIGLSKVLKKLTV
ncbi:MAG: hypothetical protein GQ534_06925 [Candidatus Delongbacteria bacterium]|nr:hypothetical protein [Candidatus Delongbacteria bacterium]